jgi:amidophosphoribosyltransferase
MCGILGVVARSPVNQLLYDGLLLLQHRGQDAAGIVTAERNSFHMHKAPGMVRDVFRTRNMRSLPGEMGIAHCRYPTAGSAFSSAEAQPFYVNSPFGIVLGHNGNLTNSEALKEEMFRTDLRHINTGSDSEVLVNVLAHELEKASVKLHLDPQTVFAAVAQVHRRVRGAYAVVAMIAGYGVLAFRDPFGIRPAVIGYNETAGGGFGRAAGPASGPPLDPPSGSGFRGLGVGGMARLIANGAKGASRPRAGAGPGSAGGVASAAGAPLAAGDGAACSPNFGMRVG